jgi:DNA polymerase-3 subunit delta'
VVVIEQAETMGEAAANALLKTLEEPGRATLILIAPDADALLTTLVSRCQRIPFSRLSAAEVATVLQRVGYGDILQHPNLLAIAQGSPGLAIASWQQLQIIPADLLSDLQTPPTSLQQALELGRRIDQTLDTETQLWLIEYLQQTYWQQHQSVPHAVAYLQAFEQARRCLLQYVQPRLVWEVTLMTVQQQMAPWR